MGYRQFDPVKTTTLATLCLAFFKNHNVFHAHHFIGPLIGDILVPACAIGVGAAVLPFLKNFVREQRRIGEKSAFEKFDDKREDDTGRHSKRREKQRYKTSYAAPKSQKYYFSTLSFLYSLKIRS